MRSLVAKEIAVYIIGLGCEAGAPANLLTEIVERALHLAGVEPRQVSALATLEARGGETALLALAASMKIPLLTFSAARLEDETPRLANPSERVFALVGCHGVAEAAALAAAGAGACLVLEKITLGKATAAIAAVPPAA